VTVAENEGSALKITTALVIGPLFTAIGIAWTAIAPSDASSAAVLVGLVTCIYGTHLYGRRGAEGAFGGARDPERAESAPPPAKKSTKKRPEPEPEPEENESAGTEREGEPERLAKEAEVPKKKGWD
jgi:hypothetical protein